MRSALAVFLGTMVVLGAALAWLCWQLIRQDRELETQRAQERLEQAADRTAASLQASLHDFDHWLTAGVPPDGITVLVRSDAGWDVRPAGEHLYLPPLSTPVRTPDRVFAAAERLEFQSRDSSAASQLLQPLSAAHDPQVRAGALLRLGRNLRKLGRQTEALDVYSQLALLRDVTIEDIPAELAALDARCTVLEAIGRREELNREALRMDAGLRGGRWRVSGQLWDFYRAEAARWAAVPPLSDHERNAVALTRGAEWLSRLWPNPLEPQGRRFVQVPNGPVLVSWSAVPGKLTAILARADYVRSMWQRSDTGSGSRAALIDADGAVLLGSVVSNSPRAVRSPVVKGLAATLVLTLADSTADRTASAVRRRFLLAGFGVLALILIAGSYFILRAMARENAVARLQSEFVSAVSHEFRTPLTSMRQMSELLMRERIASAEERRHSYRILFQASERLQRLVESLLDFGRMEAGTYRYKLEDLDPHRLVGDIVKEFRESAAPSGFEVDVMDGDNVPLIRADRDALGLALWNLLDNAVKYSGAARSVCVEIKPEGCGVAISVIDHGPGIEPGEQSRIFDKFVRGSAALKENIKGTGIGLSIVRRIVRAHGGEIRLISQPGKGSMFTIFIPGKCDA